MEYCQGFSSSIGIRKEVLMLNISSSSNMDVAGDNVQGPRPSELSRSIAVKLGRTLQATTKVVE